MSERKEPSPLCYKLPPIEYYGAVLVFNKQRLSQLGLSLAYFPLPTSSAIIAVGSDGKLERHPQSKTELVVVVPSNGDKGSRLSKNLSRYLHHIVKDSSFDFPFNGVLEYKVVGNPASPPLSYFLGRESSVYPDRIMNSQLVAGDEGLFTKLRQQVLEEIGDEGPLGKRIRRKMRQQLKDYKRAQWTGYYRQKMIFDLQENLQFYNEANDDMRTGFKMSHLRSVQRKLDILTAASVQRGLLPINPQTVRNLPTNTRDRLDYFSELINFNVNELAEAYLWFLQRYHQIQECYKNKRTAVSLEFDRGLFDRYNQVINQFVNQRIEDLIK